jgi:hypothetical protein
VIGCPKPGFGSGKPGFRAANSQATFESRASQKLKPGFVAQYSLQITFVAL